MNYELRQNARRWLLFGAVALLFPCTLQAQRTSPDNNSLHITPIAQLTPNHRARIRGVVEEVHGQDYAVRDFSGTITVHNASKNPFNVGTVIEATGDVAQSSTGLILADATIAMPSTGNHDLPVLKTVADVRNLPALEAERGFPVSITGALTYYESDPAEKLQFVQDGTAGIYIGLGNRKVNFPPAGTTVEITGYTGPGGFAPIVEEESVRVIGPGQYPTAPPLNSQLLLTGGEDSQWIELSGVVHSITTDTNRAVAAVSIGGVMAQMIVLDHGIHSVPPNFIGASISARGVCRTIFDKSRHLTGVGLCVPGWDQVQVKAAESSDPFGQAPRPISELFEFHAGAGANRSHVRGQIIMRQPDGSFIVQDASGGILVQPEDAVPSGEWVDVVGFPALKDQLPVLQDALVRPAQQPAKGQIAPLSLSAETALNAAYNSMLVTFDARVLAHSYSSEDETVTLQFGQMLTDAIMAKKPGDALGQFEPGSTLRLTGVYAARLDNNRQIQSFQILLRSPRDAVVVAVPPWWNARRALYIFGALAGVLLLSLAWVAGLREQVRRRTAQLCEEIEERKRMEAQVEKAHRELLEISRKNGMAEVATSVLHNVGNVLNSANVSATLLRDNTKKSSVASLSKTMALLQSHQADLGEYLTSDPKGKQVPGYLNQISQQLVREQQQTVAELDSLRQHLDHIIEIVAMQQNYAKVSGVAETVKVTELVEDALRLNEGMLTSHQIKVVRNYGAAPDVKVEKYKAVEIIVNLIQNAANAMNESGIPDKILTLQAGQSGGGRAKIAVIDTGIGIAPENLTRIFAHGFTTRAGGHGFGLHTGSLSAREMGGSLNANSDGPGKGATFVFELPAANVQAN